MDFNVLPKRYQGILIKNIIKIYKKYPKDMRAFLAAATGTGKTWMAYFLILLMFKNKTAKVIWAVHQTNMAIQSKNDLLDFLTKQEISYTETKNKNGTTSIKVYEIEIVFTTWQALAIAKTKCDFLVIDEVHKGSSKSYITGEAHSEHSSFKTILKLSKSHLYISATPLNLDEELFPGLLREGTLRDGSKVQAIENDRRVVYSPKQAFADGAIVNTEMICIQTASTLKAKNMDIEYNFNTMDDGARLIKSKNIDIKNLKSRIVLNRSMIESVLECFCQKEIVNGRIPPTIIFAKSVADATKMLTADSLKREVMKIIRATGKATGVQFPTGKSLVRIVTSKEGNSDTDFEDFRNGKFSILIVVGMAKEGFNAPATEVLIDFNLNVKNLRDYIQKIGRGARPSDGKFLARYYYPDSFENYLIINKQRMRSDDSGKKDIENAIRCFSEEMASSEDIVEAVASAVRTQMLVADNGIMEENDEDGRIALNNIESLKPKKPGSDMRMIVTSTSICLDDVYNENPLKNLRIKGLFDKVERVEGKYEDLSDNYKILAYLQRNKKK